MRDLEIEFTNLGPVKSGKVKLAPLTIICGRNNAGKTYVSHGIYLLFQNMFFPNALDRALLTYKKIDGHDFSKGIWIDFSEEISYISANLEKITISSQDMADFFNLDISNFFNTKISLLRKTKNWPELFFQTEFSGDIFFDLDPAIFVKKEKNSFDCLLQKKNQMGKSLPSFSKINALILHGTILSIFMEVANIKASYDDSIITAERTGISIFYKALDKITSDIGYKLALNKKRGINEDVGLADVYDFPLPIKENIDQIRRGERRSISAVFDADLAQMFERITGGSFDDSGNEIQFTPKELGAAIPMSATSSSIKSIYLIENYAKYHAQKDGVVIIDEPELQLHPDHQVEMARLLAMLVNKGVNVVITTHSDHLLREINNLIMLASDKLPESERQDLIEEYNIPPAAILAKEKVNAYVISTKEKQIFAQEMTDYGINLELFNQEIHENNRRARSIADTLSEYLEAEADNA